MSGTFSARLRQVGILVVIVAFGVGAPGAFAKPHTPAGPADLTADPTPQSGLAVSSVSSAPAGAAAGASFAVHGEVANSSGSDLSGNVTLRLLLRGQAPRVVGSSAVRVGAGSTGTYEATVAVPAEFPEGSYALTACTPVEGEGLLSCATARRGVVIGNGGAQVLGTAVRHSLANTPTPAAAAGACTPGAHSLSHLGDHVYPEMGNGGYTSIHTDVNFIYDAVENEFLPGTNVVLGDQATQCLSDFSLDFERKGPDNEEGPGPDMQVEGVTVNGVPATFTFVQPTYPGDPNGQNDPNPAAHEAGLEAQVSEANPLPPACAPNGEESPPVEGEAAIGDQCPANKLVITPARPIAAGESFSVEVKYSGTPGVHTDGDGSAEGWFLSDEPAGDGSFVTTEPVGTEAWMPLNNHPSAKPTYDFNETVTLGRTAIANGELIGFSSNPPDADFPGGSTTWHWHSPEPIASYLVESSVGSYDLSERLGGDGVLYYEAQASSLKASAKIKNKAVMDTQEEIVAFQERFAGPFPFTTDGVIIGATEASFEEEMQGKITFVGGSIDESTFNHENMHQWFGDNVSEGNYDMTFYKEGLATLSEDLLEAKEAAIAAGGLDTPAGEAAFEASLVAAFTASYNSTSKTIWTGVPSDPNAATLFRNSTTYQRPGTTYIALRQILGADNFAGALRELGEKYGGGSIDEPQLEEVFTGWLPNQSNTCRARLGTFFTEWFDTSFAASGDPRTLKPQLTGPGLPASASGTTFYDTSGSCRQAAPVTVATLSPDPIGGVYTDPTVTLKATPGAGGATVVGTTYSIDGGAQVQYKGPFTVTGTGVHKLTYFSTDADGGVERSHTMEIVVNDPPVTTAQILPAPVGGKVVGPATVVLTAKDDSSGIKVTEYGLDGGALGTYTGPLTIAAPGDHTLAYRSVDGAGAVETTKHLSFTVVAPVTCTKPRLKVRVVHPLGRRHGAVVLRQGRAYRYAGRLTCAGKSAPKGTAVTVSTAGKGHGKRKQRVSVGRNGKINTLLRLAGKRSIVFAFSDGSGSARATVHTVTMPRRR